MRHDTSNVIAMRHCFDYSRLRFHKKVNCAVFFVVACVREVQPARVGQVRFTGSNGAEL